MSRRPTDPRIAESPDLRRLADEGYALEVFEGHLLVHGIPFVTATRTVARGTLVSTINFAGEVAIPPETHVACWIGEHPCDVQGRKLRKIENATERRELGPTLVVDHTFSAKPVTDGSGRYPSYYEKVTEYANRIVGPAQVLSPDATARNGDVVELREDTSVFRYTDTATARAGIGALAQRLAVERVAIVGLGGTGAFVLDLLAKMPIRELHLFDHDEFVQSNAFRSPGAISLEELRSRPLKVEYYQRRYDVMRRNVIAHPFAITAETVSELARMSVVFLCVDSGEARRIVAEYAQANGILLIDVGVGMVVSNDALIAQARVSVLSAERSGALTDLSFSQRNDEQDPYRMNIQTADLNALNAVLAVVRWKRLRGFYHDQSDEDTSIFEITTNSVVARKRP